MSFVTDHMHARKGKLAQTIAQGLVVLIALFIAVQSLTPSVSVGGSIYSDKVVHAVAYFGLTALAIWAWPRVGMIKIAAATFLFGTAIEFIQGMFIMGRTGSFWDGAANLFGILAALIIMRSLLRNSRFK